ncbi:MAG TPA: hypothetical protein PLA44_13595, partial [Propionibacteriaceae bacterium]|nr:hypothetical protein [Propionibacteriaceae bacterium]
MGSIGAFSDGSTVGAADEAGRELLLVDVGAAVVRVGVVDLLVDELAGLLDEAAAVVRDGVGVGVSRASDAAIVSLTVWRISAQ